MQALCLRRGPHGEYPPRLWRGTRPACDWESGLSRHQPLKLRLEFQAQLRGFLARRPVRHLREDLLPKTAVFLAPRNEFGGAHLIEQREKLGAHLFGLWLVAYPRRRPEQIALRSVRRRNRADPIAPRRVSLRPKSKENPKGACACTCVFAGFHRLCASAGCVDAKAPAASSFARSISLPARESRREGAACFG